MLREFGVKTVIAQRGAVPNHQKVHFRAGHRHVHASVFGEKTNNAFCIGAGESNDHDVAFLTLESVHGLDRKPPLGGRPFTVKKVLEQGDLPSIRGDDTDG